jgi:hypothetical protein
LMNQGIDTLVPELDPNSPVISIGIANSVTADYAGLTYANPPSIGALQYFTPATYTDTFIRVNAVLSYPWVEPAASSTGGDLQIISNLVLAHGTQPGDHYFDIYQPAIISANQFSTTTIESVATSGPFSSQGVIVRGLVLNQYYNDLVPTPTGNGGLYAIGYENGSDFNPQTVTFPGATSYVVGDTHTLSVVSPVGGGCPVFFWAFHNTSLEASGVDVGNCYHYGVPGTGSVVDMNSTPTVKSGAWTAGSLPALNASATPSDNFTRANGFMGYNWWEQMLYVGGGSFTCVFNILSNQAVTDSGCATVTSGALNLWTTPRPSLTQKSNITWGSTSVWEGPVVRATPGVNDGVTSTTYYLVIYFSGSPLLFARDGGGFHSLPASLCSSGTPTNLELDASGSGPVTLTVKINGTTCGTPYVDSTYNFTGNYIGFEGVGPSTAVAGWSGN